VISTVDFITPPVDDPVWFGRIGAANSLSDVYAMGGRPVTALNLVMFPTKKLDTEVLRRILLGGHEKVVEAGASLAGGHSVDDREPKYGLAVTGIVSPDRILTNRGARPGDGLVLTKPVGSGVLFNGCRSGRLPFRELEAVLPQIAALNRTALETALSYDIHACTDITGFGLLGHALEMATASGVAIELDFSAVPLYPNVLEMYRKGETTGSNPANRELLRGRLELKAALSREEAEALVDPQTSGGLLFSLPPDQADELVERLKAAGVPAASRVGRVGNEAGQWVRVV